MTGVVGARRRILVIKLGALGDMVLALGPFAAIRARHGEDHLTLLTTAPYAEMARASPYFDMVWSGGRPSTLAAWWRLRRCLRQAGFARIYDLQTSDRTGWYFRIIGPGRRPEWSGIAPGCSHPHDNPLRDGLHSLDRQAEQLRVAGIETVQAPDLSWATADLARFNLPRRYILMAPGGAAHRPAKRWPAESYAELARRMAASDAIPMLVGTQGEAAANAAIAASSVARDLTGATNLIEIAALARSAAGAVGNDTGPMHLAAAAGCPATVLFSEESDPALSAPRGDHVTVLRRQPLAALSVDEVAAAIRLR